MQRKTFPVGSYEANCSFLSLADGRTLVVDPGQEGDRLLGFLAAAKLTPVAIALTHGHYDHDNAIPDLLRAHPTLPVYVTAADRAVMTHPYNVRPPEYLGVPLADATWRPAERLSEDFPEFRVRVLPTPGHSPGGVCYHFPDESLLLSGDTLFAGTVGRTDFPGGDMALLLKSLELLRALPDETRVVPGHGEETTIGREKRENPYLARCNLSSRGV